MLVGDLVIICLVFEVVIKVVNLLFSAFISIHTFKPFDRKTNKNKFQGTKLLLLFFMELKLISVCFSNKIFKSMNRYKSNKN